jgi:ribonuclease R
MGKKKNPPHRNASSPEFPSEKEVLERLEAQLGRPHGMRSLAKSFDIPHGKLQEFEGFLDGLAEAGKLKRLKGKKYLSLAGEAGGGAQASRWSKGGRGREDRKGGFRERGENREGRRFRGGDESGSGERRSRDGEDLGDSFGEAAGKPRRGDGAPRSEGGPQREGLVKGKVIRQGGFHFVVPLGSGGRDGGGRDGRVGEDDLMVLIPKRNLGRAKPGDIVTARILQEEDGERIGKILSTLQEDIPFANVSKAFFREYNVPQGYPKQALNEAGTFPEPVWEAYSNRVDYRDKLIITIDPVTARDHDDAISLERNEKGNWILGVHIADVSEYVTDDSSLDSEALYRAFTQYLPWTAAPMLPQRLSSDLCSLLEHRERLAFTCVMEVTPDGEMLDFNFVESFIKVAKFYSYEEAQTTREAGDPFLAQLDVFTKALQARRRLDGFIDFQFPEPKVELDDKGVPARIYPGKRLASHSWIEECMLLANQATARFLTKHKLPGLFRVHEQPDLEAVAELWRNEGTLHHDKDMADMVRKLNQTRGYLNPTIQKFFIRLLSQEGGALPASVQRKILQSMKKAQYSAESLGHFALGWSHYAHFTSPIRRYADLWTHRMIKMFVRGGKIPRQMKTRAADVAERISEKEIAVMKVERKGLKTATAWVLRQHIGQEFTAEVSGMENFGVFVSLTDPFGEGLIPVKYLKDDYYVKDEETGHLVGRRTRNRFQLGDKLKVRLERSDPFTAQVDFFFLGRA